MVSKKLLAVVAASLLSVNLWANENDSSYSQVEICESNYSKCLDKCDANEGGNTESCYDKCDQEYSNCMDKIQSEN